MKGFVSLSGEDDKIPIIILRDSAASQSVIRQGILNLSGESYVNSNALVRGVGMRLIGVPLHTVCIECSLVKGRVVVGVRPELPVDGVLGNDLAGGKVLLNPEVTVIPLPKSSGDLVEKCPDVFPVCAVTHAMSAKKREPAVEEGEFDLSNSFLYTPIDLAHPQNPPEAPRNSSALEKVWLPCPNLRTSSKRT